jgi:hypothetical protein
MWVHDIVSTITALSTEQHRLPIGVLGAGRPGKAALFAAALDPRIAAVQVRLPSLSYRDEAEQGLLADIPRILATLDLPELAKLVLPRGCWLEFAGSVTEQRIRSIYGAAFTAKGFFRAEPAGVTHWRTVANWFSDRLTESTPGPK